ncbi:DsbA family protein [Nannocystaceae bacterium ST9]
MPRSLRLVPLALFALACHRDPTTPPADEPGDPADDRSIGLVGEDGQLQPDPEQVAAGVPHLRFHVEVDDSPSRGPADAPVTIVMFSDFECPYCADALATIAALEREYSGEIRFVYKALPLDTHPSAMLAALVGHSAQEQGKFWPFHDRLFGGGEIDEDTIVEYARESGLDLEQVAREVEALTWAPEIRRDLRTAKRLQLRSTPVFFINGRMLPGARPKHIFRQIIDQELDLAKQLRAAGISDDRLYAHVTQWGYTAIQYRDDRPELDEDTVYPVPIADSPTRGPADAPITIVAFSDFQCPFCTRGDATMRELQQRYGDQIRFVFKHFPLPGHARGALASRVSFAAMQAGKFWEFHDGVFDLGPGFTAADLLALGESLGISVASMESALTDESNDPRIEQDIELGMRLGVTGTPAYFINGRPIVGAHPEIDFRMLIVEELGRVEAAKAEGVAAKDVYRHLTGASE